MCLQYPAAGFERCARQVLDALVADKALGARLAAPSVSYGAANLYMRGPLEEATRGNLARVRGPRRFPRPAARPRAGREGRRHTASCQPQPGGVTSRARSHATQRGGQASGCLRALGCKVTRCTAAVCAT